MVSCAACGCSQTTTNKNLGITFHSYPKNYHTRDAWINFIKRPEWSVKSSSVLCSRHFTEQCFDRTSQLKVRLLPTAVPTIEVDRLKYVRTFNPISTRPAEDATHNRPTKYIKLESNDMLDVPKPSSCMRTQSPIQRGEESLSTLVKESPCERNLKRKICELHRQDVLKSQKIRQLQKVVWRQKKQISSLKSTVGLLKKNKLMLEEHENIIL